MNDKHNEALSNEEAKFKEVEEQWRLSLPRRTDSWLIETYGNREVAILCEEKLQELYPEYAALCHSYKQKREYVCFRFPNEVESHLVHSSLDRNLGEHVKCLYRQIVRFCVIYEAATGRERKDSRIPEDQLLHAREYPTHQLYEGKLRHFGGKFLAQCCFHQENNPSLIFYPDGSFHCFGCQAHGSNAIDFLMKQGIEFIDAVRRLV